MGVGTYVCAKSLQPYPTLCDSMHYSPQVSSVHGILQARIVESVAMPSFWGFSQPRDRTCISCTAGRFFTPSYQGSPHLRVDGTLLQCPFTAHWGSREFEFY